MRLNPRVTSLAIVALVLAALPTPVKALGVCADPDYLPYSNRAGEGFENKIAEAVAKALGEKVEYTWASTRGHGGFTQFLSTTLDAKKCDVVMNIPYGTREELTTRPYYVSSYVFVYPKGKNYSLTSLDSPILKKLRVGFERETPAEDGLKIRGLLPGTSVPFDVSGDPSESPASMLAALKNEQIDVLFTWQPAIGGFLRGNSDLQVTMVPNGRTLGAPEQYSFPMSMGVREGNQALKDKLDSVISKSQAELSSILTASGILLFGSTAVNQ
jgi:mxaJ protein